jgi:Ni/Co efflux regulator RcnB
MRSTLILIAAVVAGLAASTGSAANLTVQATFTDKQRELIVSYSQKQSAPVTSKKGKSKDKGLPPGIAMNLERGKALPPGIAKKGLPQDLVVVLPPPPRGHEIVVVDGRVLLVEIATQVIRDRLEDVFLK